MGAVQPEIGGNFGNISEFSEKCHLLRFSERDEHRITVSFRNCGKLDLLDKGKKNIFESRCRRKERKKKEEKKESQTQSPFLKISLEDDDWGKVRAYDSDQITIP